MEKALSVSCTDWSHMLIFCFESCMYIRRRQHVHQNRTKECEHNWDFEGTMSNSAVHDWHANLTTGLSKDLMKRVTNTQGQFKFVWAQVEEMTCLTSRLLARTHRAIHHEANTLQSHCQGLWIGVVHAERIQDCRAVGDGRVRGLVESSVDRPKLEQWSTILPVLMASNKRKGFTARMLDKDQLLQPAGLLSTSDIIQTNQNMKFHACARWRLFSSRNNSCTLYQVKWKGITCLT